MTGETRSSNFRTDIQGLRAVAVILVVLYHADTPLSGGFVGVDVFFAISGFVIGRLLLRELEARGSIDLKRFYSRRVRRLIPALGVMLIGVGIASALILSPEFPQPVALETGAWAAASSANIYLWFLGGGYFGPLDEQNPFVHTWSLGIEEQFYLVFPILVAGTWALATRRSGDPQRSLRRVLMAVIVLSLAVSLLLAHNLFGAQDWLPGGDRFAFYGPFGRAWEFAAGVRLAMFMGRRDSLGPAWLSWLGLGILAAVSIWLDGSITFPGLAAIPPVGAALVLMLNGSVGVRRILEHEWLVWIGDRSYGWYLWHWPFIVFARLMFPSVPFIALLAAALSLIPTVASYRYVESRFRVTSEKVSTPSAAVPVLLGFAVVPFVFLVAGALMPTNSWGLPEHPERLEANASNLGACHQYRVPVERCTIEPSDGEAEGTVLLVGDSHSGAISTAVQQAAEENNFRLVMRTASACPFVMAEENFEEECLDHNVRLIELAEELRPDAIIVANRSTVYPAKFDFNWRVGNLDVDSVATEASIQLWQEAFGDGIAAVEPFVDRVVVFSVVPHFGVAEFDRSLPSLLWPDGVAPIVETDEIQKIRVPVLEAEAAALDQVAVPTVTIDPLQELCDETCRLLDNDGRYLYRDPSHLTPLGASRFVPAFSKALSTE